MKSGMNLGMVVGCLLGAATPAVADVTGDVQACSNGQGPAIQANIVGLKDHQGEVRLELYPATEADFLRDDHALMAEGKVFRRVRAPAPTGAITMCIKVPRPGRYALLFSHNRGGKDKFDLWHDGAGFPGNAIMGRSRPTVTVATIDAGAGVTVTNIRVQYLRGLRGFAPLDR